MKLTVDDAVAKGVNNEVQIRLNGIVQKWCVRASEEEGEVDLISYNAFSETVETETVKGTVQILLGDRL